MSKKDTSSADALAHLQQVAAAGRVSDIESLAGSLASACFASDRKVNAAEAALVSDILQHLIRDVEKPVRQALANHLAVREDAPHDLLVMLAKDVIEVSYGVLINSPILSDEDLVRVIVDRAREHHVAIAQRVVVSETVSDALVDTGDSVVVASLLRNDGACLRPETMARLVDQSREIEPYQELLLGRKDLNVNLAIRMADWVGDTLKSFIVDRYGLDAAAVGDAVSRAVLDAVSHDILGEPAAPAKADRMEGCPGSEEMLKALRSDDLPRFKKLFQRVTQLGPDMVSKLLYNSPEGLAIACRGLGFDVETFSRILCHLYSTEIYEQFRKSPMCRRLTDYFDGLERPKAEKVLNGWRVASASAA